MATQTLKLHRGSALGPVVGSAVVDEDGRLTLHVDDPLTSALLRGPGDVGMSVSWDVGEARRGELHAECLRCDWSASGTDVQAVMTDATEHERTARAADGRLHDTRLTLPGRNRG